MGGIGRQVSKGLGFLFEEAFSRGTKESLSEAGQTVTKHGGAFSKTIFGDAPIPSGAQGLFGPDGFSTITTDIFTKAIKNEPSVRGNLETLIRRGSEGNDEAFEVLGQMATDFSVTDTGTKQLTKGQTHLGNLKAKGWSQKMEAIDAARNPETVTGSKGRAAKNKVHSDFKAGSEYTSGSIFARLKNMITNRHHGIGLDDSNNVWRWHRTGAEATPNNPSPILQARESIMGVKSGNAEENMVDVIEQITKPSREARQLQFNEMSGGLLEQTTLDDFFGQSKYNPRELTELETGQFEVWRKKTGGSVEQFMDTVKPDKGSKFPEGQFPDIRVYKPGSNSKELLETISIKTAADHKTRLSKVFDVLDEHGYKTADARKATSVKNLRIDSKLDIYGNDHKVIHNVIDALKAKKGTALNEIQTLGEEGIRDLPLDEAIKLDIRSVQEMETVLANVLSFRYKEIEKLFKELYPNGYKGFKESFGELGAEAKNQFFKENINTIAIRGKVDKAITINNALKKPKWDPNVGDTFGWQPQSLFATVEEIEEVVKEFLAKN